MLGYQPRRPKCGTEPTCSTCSLDDRYLSYRLVDQGKVARRPYPSTDTLPEMQVCQSGPIPQRRWKLPKVDLAQHQGTRNMGLVQGTRRGRNCRYAGQHGVIRQHGPMSDSPTARNGDGSMEMCCPTWKMSQHGLGATWSNAGLGSR